EPALRSSSGGAPSVILRSPAAYRQRPNRRLDARMILQQLVNGLTLGSLYALIALGYTMVYGVLLMINFAHSEVFMAGAFVSCLLMKLSWLQNNPPGTVLLMSILGGLLVSAIAAVLVERLAYRPLRRAGR